MRIKYLLVIVFILLPLSALGVLNLADSLAGFIVLQVESKGEAWYINPSDRERYYLGRPIDAWDIMRQSGIGISNYNLKKIPIGAVGSGADSDSDNLSDSLERAIGTDPENYDSDRDGLSDAAEILSNRNPLANGYLPIDMQFTKEQLGKIFLQVEAHGEAWYISPSDNRRYYLGRPGDAFNVMRILGLGISNDDLAQIAVGRDIPEEERIIEEVEISESEVPLITNENIDYSKIELLVHEKVNQERINYGLLALAWNEEIAAVGREHSLNLAVENNSITGLGHSCDYPLIHHEGMDFGFKNSNRLKNRNIFYFGKAGENIALVNASNITVELEFEDPNEIKIDNCPYERNEIDLDFRAKLNNDLSETEAINLIMQELSKRKALFEQTVKFPIIEEAWLSEDEIADKIVEGWLNSPGHKDNILEEDYEESGVGITFVNGYIIATQTYIERVACGYQSGPCCEQAGYYPYCYVPLECKENICQ